MTNWDDNEAADRLWEVRTYVWRLDARVMEANPRQVLADLVALIEGRETANGDVLAGDVL